MPSNLFCCRLVLEARCLCCVMLLWILQWSFGIKRSCLSSESQFACWNTAMHACAAKVTLMQSHPRYHFRVQSVRNRSTMLVTNWWKSLLAALIIKSCRTSNMKTRSRLMGAPKCRLRHVAIWGFHGFSNLLVTKIIILICQTSQQTS